VSCRNKSFLFVAVLSASWFTAAAQGISAGAKQGNVMQLTRERDKEKEDQVAKLFEGIRADAKLPRLKRIRHRESLEEEVCTIVLTGKVPKASLTNTSGFYKTPNPQSINSDLSKVAMFDQLHPNNNRGFARYSVVVWPAKDLESGTPTYWVGVRLFANAVFEFFDNHFTDEIEYHNLWKKTIAPECRNK
jgi:hypothetical protein